MYIRPGHWLRPLLIMGSGIEESEIKIMDTTNDFLMTAGGAPRCGVGVQEATVTKREPAPNIAAPPTPDRRISIRQMACFMKILLATPPPSLPAAFLRVGCRRAYRAGDVMCGGPWVRHGRGRSPFEAPSRAAGNCLGRDERKKVLKICVSGNLFCSKRATRKFARPQGHRGKTVRWGL